MDQLHANFPCSPTVINYFLAVTRVRLCLVTCFCFWFEGSLQLSAHLRSKDHCSVLSPLVGQDTAFHSPSSPFSPGFSPFVFFFFLGTLGWDDLKSYSYHFAFSKLLLLTNECALTVNVRNQKLDLILKPARFSCYSIFEDLGTLEIWD